ncbi:DUF3800 domain-containing protein [uncultured Paludibaculum sp.]|uniref:DUF3800 domain-containing protein n=1 Tax=uncultured Paludibaculum sp. TaxID=1765020 RepID=UPI002AAB6635|nr:DUF3800 domain-containing protein [uncultured Paludibaculum sp.]
MHETRVGSPQDIGAWYPQVAVERAALAVRWTKVHSAAFFMYLLYLDDAGSSGNPAEAYFVLGGICVYEAQADWFTRELDKLAASFDAQDPSSVEFHASAIFSRRQVPWKGLGQEEARGVIKSVLNVARTSYDSACCFACAIEKASLPPDQDCVALAFEDLCQRFNFFLARRAGRATGNVGCSSLTEALRRLRYSA